MLEVLRLIAARQLVEQERQAHRLAALLRIHPIVPGRYTRSDS